MTGFTESDVEDAALERPEALGWRIARGPDLAPDSPGAERADCDGVVLERRLRGALARLNPDLPATTLEDAFRKLLRPDDAPTEARTRAMHRRLANGATVECRAGDSTIRGAQARIIDFDDPDGDDRLAVSQLVPRRKFLIILPKDIAQAFGDLVQQLFAHAFANSRASRILATLRDTLPSKLISGEVRMDGIPGLRETAR